MAKLVQWCKTLYFQFVLNNEAYPLEASKKLAEVAKLVQQYSPVHSLVPSLVDISSSRPISATIFPATARLWFPQLFGPSASGLCLEGPPTLYELHYSNNVCLVITCIIWFDPCKLEWHKSTEIANWQ